MSNPKVIELRIALKIYAKPRADMIDMEVNDVLEVYSTTDKGWSKGKNLRTNLVGFFPTNYTKTKPAEQPKAID